jgi:hypothetical protein
MSPSPARLHIVGVLLAAAVVATACAGDHARGAGRTAPAGLAASPQAAPSVTAAPDRSSPTPSPSSPPDPSPHPLTSPPTPQPAATAAPDWLGQRVLPRTASGFGEVQVTPPELADRRIVTPDHLPPPPDATFRSSVAPVPAGVRDRSTWQPGCPVDIGDLRYVQLSFWGFDQRAHTGELLVHATVADDVVAVFRDLHDARFPIEEMRIVHPDELDAPPTGDGNNTTAFVCRPVRGQDHWSQHAHGLAVDINPFHNPYRKGELVLPELASAYTDRAHVRPGMVIEGDVATSGFDAIGWGWGGRWSSLKDWMHFSADGT